MTTIQDKANNLDLMSLQDVLLRMEQIKTERKILKNSVIPFPNYTIEGFLKIAEQAKNAHSRSTQNNSNCEYSASWNILRKVFKQKLGKDVSSVEDIDLLLEFIWKDQLALQARLEELSEEFSLLQKYEFWHIELDKVLPGSSDAK
jgi:hypothetical protein